MTKLITGEHKQTRFKLAVFCAVVLSLALMFSIYRGQEAVGVVCATALAAVVERYLKRETDRPSI